MPQLTAVELKNAMAGKRLQDGNGLLFQKTETGGKWIFRYQLQGRRRDMGLGSWPDVTLADARRARKRWAALLQQGLDPIAERKRIKDSEAAALIKTIPTFAEIAEMAFEARKDQLRPGGATDRWFSQLRLHVIPKIGRKPITDVDRMDVYEVLKPIWRSKHETASKALIRTRIVLRHARAMGFDIDPSICDDAGLMLGHVEQLSQSIPATPWQEIPALFEKLNKPHASHQALRWIILTAVRSTPARGALFSEIEGDIWTVPAERMKGRRGKVQDFRVPLSTAALALVEARRSVRTSDYLFESPRTGCVDQNALIHTLNNIGEHGRPHGFRTSFRTWVQDTDESFWDAAETALTHTIGNRVERTYARSDLLDKRRILMEKWGRFVCGEEKTTTD